MRDPCLETNRAAWRRGDGDAARWVRARVDGRADSLAASTDDRRGGRSVDERVDHLDENQEEDRDFQDVAPEISDFVGDHGVSLRQNLESLADQVIDLADAVELHR